METVRPVTPPAQTPAPDPSSRAPIPSAAAGEPERQLLRPAVSLELSEEATRAVPKEPPSKAPDQSRDLQRGFERDRDTQALVYRITDAASGDLILQFPDEAVMKARAYARQVETSVGERVERTA